MTNGESGIDLELRQALDVTPSPEFVARVRLRIASEPERSTWRLPWMFAVAGAGALAIVVAVVALRPHQQPLPRTANGTVSTPGAVVPGRRPESLETQGFSPIVATPASSSAAVSRAKSLGAQGVSPAVSRSAARGAPEPDVLVSPAEMRGLRRLIALANQGDTGLESLLAPLADPTPIPDIESVEIVIAPITIEPLDSTTQ